MNRLEFYYNQGKTYRVIRKDAKTPGNDNRLFNCIKFIEKHSDDQNYIIMMSTYTLHFAFLLIIAVILFITFTSSFLYPSVAFHTPSTSNVTIHTEEMEAETTATSQPQSSNITNSTPSISIETAKEIYNHTNQALQALREGNTSEILSQLNGANQKLSSIIFVNGSGQQEQEQNTTEVPAAAGDTTAIGNAATDSSPESASGDTARDREELEIESEIRENSRERNEAVPNDP
ncbi:MAG: hypothetical protein ACR2IS_13980 [Nitrososphaeraceae archaeon]